MGNSYSLNSKTATTQFFTIIDQNNPVVRFKMAVIKISVGSSVNLHVIYILSFKNGGGFLFLAVSRRLRLNARVKWLTNKKRITVQFVYGMVD